MNGTTEDKNQCTNCRHEASGVQLPVTESMTSVNEYAEAEQPTRLPAGVGRGAENGVGACA